MSAMKEYATAVSEALGLDGELTDEVMHIGQRLLRDGKPAEAAADYREDPSGKRKPRAVCGPLVETLSAAMPKGFTLYPAGSYLRGRDTVKDLDCVIMVPDELDLQEAAADLMDALPDDFNPTLKQRTGRIVRGTLGGLQIDLYLCHHDEMGTMTMFLTGPMEFNMHCRVEAKRQGLLLSQYGLFERDGRRVPVCDCSTELPVFERLSIPYATPAERDLWRR